MGQENLKKLVDASERCKKRVVPVQMVKDILSTTTQDVADDIIAQIPSGNYHPALSAGQDTYMFAAFSYFAPSNEYLSDERRSFHDDLLARLIHCLHH